jgi:hypothetical protein
VITEDLFTYHKFGWNWQIAFNREGILIENVIITIEKIQASLDQLGLVISKIAICEELEAFKNELKKLDPKQRLVKEKASRLYDLVKSVDKTIDSELKSRYAYRLTEKKLGLNNLLGNISFLFENDVFSKLSKFAQNDFIEAGKCIAFERNVGGAFCILRGTEEVLRTYYMYKISTNHVSPLLWGSMLIHLKQDGTTPSGLIALLENIKDEFRTLLHTRKRIIILMKHKRYSVNVLTLLIEL